MCAPGSTGGTTPLHYRGEGSKVLSGKCRYKGHRATGPQTKVMGMTKETRVEFQVWDGAQWTRTRSIEGIEVAAYEFTLATKASQRHKVSDAIRRGVTVGAESLTTGLMMRARLVGSDVEEVTPCPPAA